ncbi:MAG: TRAP transporter small permease subunit [Rhodobacterales bacterium]|nr:TRAP transporter small permease [Puniceibacterium antarcticum]
MLLLLSHGVGAEIILRRLFDRSLGGMDEIGGYVLAITATLAFSEALFSRAHIRIGILHGRLAPKGRAVLDVIALIGLIWFFSIILWFGWTMLMRNWGLGTRSMTPMQTPLWIPQVMWVAAMALFYLSAVLLFLQGLVSMAVGDWARAASLIGARNDIEELEDELALSAQAGLHQEEPR